ncbi:MAG: oxygen-independent coproporphyrinogen III oxidase [Candidatus Hydrogenedentota bacterium]|nr:MAG: oxygen-independent coproporphyrinogen III oxidase [Candidatus Hydrogenedentota bacterium]
MLSEQQIQEIVQKYNTPVPRYTSYPTALDWDQEYPEENFLSALQNHPAEKPISLYMHIPFCEDRCLFCGCNVLVSRKREMANPFLDNLFLEIQNRANALPESTNVIQIHAGGGTPNYLDKNKWPEIIQFLKNHFHVLESAEISIELDPMVLDEEYLEVLAEAGFNRVSFGIQDTNEKVLQEVARPQDLSHLERVIQKARELPFTSLNFDFIYGLPYQNQDNFANNIEFVRTHRPDRIAMYSYAHVPWLKRHQKRMNANAIPNPTEKLSLYLQAREAFLQMGYIEIGMDHFALESDDLVQAQKEHRLYRNFMGYTTIQATDLLAFGPSSISFFGGNYAQNHLKLKAWSASVHGEAAPFEKGIQLTEDDWLRANIIQNLMNHFIVSFENIEQKFGIDFRSYFKEELFEMENYAKENLVKMSSDSIEVLPVGRFVIRHIAKVFDAYRKQKAVAGFSKGV